MRFETQSRGHLQNKTPFYKTKLKTENGKTPCYTRQLFGACSLESHHEPCVRHSSGLSHYYIQTILWERVLTEGGVLHFPTTTRSLKPLRRVPVFRFRMGQVQLILM